MTRDRTLNKLRTQNWFGIVMTALREHGVSWELESPQKGKHPVMLLEKDGRRKRMPVPGTERGSGNHKYLAAIVRRFAENNEGKD